MRTHALLAVVWLAAGASAQPVFVEREIWTDADSCVSVHAADVDGDSDTDVISASANDDTIAWYENDGASPPGFTMHVVTDTAAGAWHAIAVDLDKDGDQDLLTASRDDDTIAWYESDGAPLPQFTQHVIATTANGAYSVVARDFDADGDLDVAASSVFDNTVAWHENTGGSPPGWTEHEIVTDAIFAAAVDAADLDGDADHDLVSVSFFDHTLAWYENDGAGGFETHMISTDAAGARGVHTADIDGDGDIDIVTATSNNNTVAWWENDGGSPPAFTFREIAANASFVRSVHAADLDGDGDLDVAAASGNDNKVAWHESDGADPPGWTEHVITTNANGGYFVVAADLDDDEDTDLVSASNMDDTVAWYENRPCLADFNEDGTLDVLDFVAFQGAWAAQDPAADCDADDAYNILDFVCFQTTFAAGCP